jgi:hypothetical protein
MVDPLLSEDLGQLVQAFPNDALRGLVAILKEPHADSIGSSYDQVEIAQK